jgi:outer membrane beta-barrel protein
MNKFRIGLLLAAAVCAYPALALAQPKPAPTKPGAAKPGAAPAAEAEEEGADEEEATEGEEEAEGEAAGEAAAEPAEGDGSGLGAICKIDPSRCVTPDLAKEAQKDLNAQVYAVQQIYAKRRGRFELNPYWAITLNDQYVKHPGPGLALNFYFSEVMAIGANFNYYQPFNVDSDFNADVRRAARVGVPLTEYDWSAALNFTYVPAYGKFAGFGDFIFHWDLYLVGGVGGISTRPIAVIDPDNRFFKFEPKLAFNAGLGARIFFNRWFAAILELRDYAFIDQLENLETTADPTQAADESTWYGDDQFTNNVQAQFGVSIFLPFSFEYRLPK